MGRFTGKEIGKAVALGFVVATYTGTIANWINKLPFVGSFDIIKTMIGGGAIVLTFEYIWNKFLEK